MTLQDCEKLARQLMTDHGIGHWTFRFDNSKNRFGCCWKQRQLISMSKKLVEANSEEEVRNTILHEIAHGLAPLGAGHDSQWKQVAASIGARPERCYTYDRVNVVKADWTATCPICGKVYHRHNAPRAGRLLACGVCEPVRFIGKALLTFTRVASSEEDERRFARNEASRRCKAKYRGYPRSQGGGDWDK